MSSKTTDEGKNYESKFTSNPSHDSTRNSPPPTAAATTTTTTTTTTSSSTAGSKSSLGASHVGKISLTKDQQLLHRAVGHLYSKIIQPKEEGGWSEWFLQHCVKFDTKKKSEHGLQYTELHKEYELMVETALVEFTAQEGIDDAQDLYERILHAKDDKKFESTVNLLLAAADYKKFVNLMKRKHRKIIKEEDNRKERRRTKEEQIALRLARNRIVQNDKKEGTEEREEGEGAGADEGLDKRK